jgi:D-alanine transfer protein
VADFSSHEYDTYFLREYSHPSDLGGAYYSKAIYTYLTTGVADTSPSGGVVLETRKE